MFDISPPSVVQGMPARCGGSPLGIKPKSASPTSSGSGKRVRPVRPGGEDIFPAVVRLDSSDRRHWLADRQRRWLYAIGKAGLFRSLVACEAVPIPAGGVRGDGSLFATGSPGKVELHLYDSPDGESGAGYGFAWLKTCGSALTCFVCAPKIRYKRGEEVKQACAWALENNMSVMMTTFTAPHYWETDVRKQMDAFNAAKRRFRSGKWWKMQKDFLGYRHAIRALEITMKHPAFGLGNGAHIHTHELDFCDRAPLDDAEVKYLLSKWLPKWRDCLLKEGVEIRDMEAFYRHGIEISMPHKDGKALDADALVKMAGYVADSTAIEMSPGIFSTSADKLAAEMAPGVWVKTGRGDGGEKSKHINHFEFMALALTKYPEARPHMLRLMAALKGRAWMTWTPGLKAEVGIEDKTDKELLAEKVGAKVRSYVTSTEWTMINRHKLQRRYIRAMDQDLEGNLEPGAVLDSADRVMRVISAGYDPLSGEELPPEPPPRNRAKEAHDRLNATLRDFVREMFGAELRLPEYDGALEMARARERAAELERRRFGLVPPDRRRIEVNRAEIEARRLIASRARPKASSAPRRVMLRLPGLRQ